MLFVVGMHCLRVSHICEVAHDSPIACNNHASQPRYNHMRLSSDEVTVHLQHAHELHSDEYRSPTLHPDFPPLITGSVHVISVTPLAPGRPSFISSPTLHNSLLAFYACRLCCYCNPVFISLIDGCARHLNVMMFISHQLQNQTVSLLKMHRSDKALADYGSADNRRLTIGRWLINTTSSSAMAEIPRELDQRFQMGGSI